jgi:hypothetical protein
MEREATAMQATRGRAVRRRVAAALGLAIGGLAASAARADLATEAYRVVGVEPQELLTGTVLGAQVLPGGAKQVVCVTTFLTGDRDKATAVNVRLDVLVRRDSELAPVYSRDLGQENGGYVGGGDVQLVDLDRDGLQEIIVSYDSYIDPLIEQRLAQVILHDAGGFQTAWAGPVAYDATRAAREIPAERRDRYRREFDLARTLGTRGRTLYVDKTVIAVAGERLAEPKTVQETFPLRASPRP